MAGTTVAEAFVTLRAETEGFVSDANRTFKRVAGLATAAFAAISAGRFLGDAIGSASNLEESMSKVNVVFGESAKEVQDWSKTAARSFGQSRQSALEAAGTYGNLFQAFGVGREESTKMSKSLVELAADLASFNNTSVDDALVALRSGLSGETEPLKRFGVALNDARLKAKALELGLYDGKGVLDVTAKSQAAYALIIEDTTLAQGDFARTSDGLANKQRIQAAQWEDLRAKIGTALLPAMSALTTFVVDKLIPAFERMAAWVQEHWPQIQATVVNAVQGIRDFVAPIIEAIQVFWRNFGDNILGFVQAVWPAIRQIIEGTLNVIRGIIQAVTALIQGDWSAVWEGIKRTLSGVWDAIAGIVRAQLEVVRAALGVGLEVLRNLWEEVWGGLRDGLYAIWETIKAIVRNAVEFIRTQIDRALGPIDDLVGKVARLVGGDNKISFDGKTIVNGRIVPSGHFGGTFFAANGVEGLALLRHRESITTPEDMAGLRSELSAQTAMLASILQATDRQTDWQVFMARAG